MVYLNNKKDPKNKRQRQQSAVNKGSSSNNIFLLYQQLLGLAFMVQFLLNLYLVVYQGRTECIAQTCVTSNTKCSKLYCLQYYFNIIVKHKVCRYQNNRQGLIIYDVPFKTTIFQLKTLTTRTISDNNILCCTIRHLIHVHTC